MKRKLFVILALAALMGLLWCAAAQADDPATRRSSDLALRRISSPTESPSATRSTLAHTMIGLSFIRRPPG